MPPELSGNSTEFALSDIQYNEETPASLLALDQLQNLAKQPIWSEARR
jgi:hypothetical protein